MSHLKTIGLSSHNANYRKGRKDLNKIDLKHSFPETKHRVLNFSWELLNFIFKVTNQLHIKKLRCWVVLFSDSSVGNKGTCMPSKKVNVQ